MKVHIDENYTQIIEPKMEMISQLYFKLTNRRICIELKPFLDFKYHKKQRRSGKKSKKNRKREKNE